MTFRILEHQMHALGHDTQTRFVETMASYLREQYPSVVSKIGEERLSTWVAGALAVAHANDIHTEPEAAQLILLLTVLGLDAERKLEWVPAAFEEGLLPEAKVERLVREGARRVPAIAKVVVYPVYQEALADALSNDAEVGT